MTWMFSYSRNNSEDDVDLHAAVFQPRIYSDMNGGGEKGANCSCCCIRMVCFTSFFGLFLKLLIITPASFQQWFHHIWRSSFQSV